MNLSFRRAVQIIKNDGFLALIIRFFYYIKLGLFGPMYIQEAIKEFKRAIKNKKTLEELFDFAKSFNYFGITIEPSQNRNEILCLLQMIQKIKPKIILEIGTADGGTLFLFSRVADFDSIIISIDLPNSRFSRYPPWKNSLYTSFARNQQKIYIINSDSHNSNTIVMIHKIIKYRKIDILFIDGDHSYDGVKQDFETYRPFVRENGLIIFHDIVPGPPALVGGVPKFWSQIKKQYKFDEIVDNWTQKSCGLGIIYNS